jgi:uncharacterized protein (TIGR02284 family)
MEKEKTIETLNKLVKINNDRIEGYEKASKNTEERDLKNLFSELTDTSRKCRTELINEINKLGGEATEETNTSGNFFRAWMDFKSALTGKDRKAILNSCEYGEENADETYQTVLDDESMHLSPQQTSMVKKQHNQLKSDQSTIKSMQKKQVQA